jgi:hypothetical protein
MDSTGSGHSSMVGACEHSNVSSGSMKSEEFYYFLYNSATWN